MTWFENNPHSKRVAHFSQSGPWEHYKIGKLILTDADFYDTPKESKWIRIKGQGNRKFSFTPHGWCELLTKHGYDGKQGWWAEFAEVDFGIAAVAWGVQHVIIDNIDVGPKEQCIFFKEELHDQDDTTSKEEFR